jgi:hypothetical protein
MPACISTASPATRNKIKLGEGEVERANGIPLTSKSFGPTWSCGYRVSMLIVERGQRATRCMRGKHHAEYDGLALRLSPMRGRPVGAMFQAPRGASRIDELLFLVVSADERGCTAARLSTVKVLHQTVLDFFATTKGKPVS